MEKPHQIPARKSFFIIKDMKKIIILILLLNCVQLNAQSDFTKILKENTYPISTEFKGSGWKFLVKNAKASDYFLVGEDHGIAEVAAVSEALFKSVNKIGYEHLAIETGPFTAKILVDLIGNDDQEKVGDFYRSNPFSVPFYGTEQEFQFLSTVHGLSGATNPIWGLDQEFLLSARPLLRYHLSGFSDEVAIKNEISIAEKGYDQILSEKKQDGVWLINQTSESWEALEALTKDQLTKDMISELKISQEIYQMNFTGKHQQNNQARVDHFVKWFEKNDKDSEGKVMIKMGAGHVMKGESIFDVYDLGDYLAKKENKQTFHLGLVQTSGFQNAYIPFRDKSALNSPVNVGMFKGFLDFVSTIIPDEGFVVLDTRVFHSKINELPEDPVVRKLLGGFDALLIFPNATASTFIE